MQEIKDCPFCAGKARLKVGEQHMVRTMRVVCSDCLAASPSIYEGEYSWIRGAPKKVFTLDEAAQEAIKIWNRRAKASY